MLSAAVFGIGLVTFTGEPVGFYWELLTPVYCAICIYVGWRGTTTRQERIRLVWTQILHWAAFLAAMWLIYSPTMRALVDVNATGLNLMTLLALATFVAGVHAAAWQICVVGLILALFVPAVAIIQRSSVFILVTLLGLTFIAVSLYLTFHTHRRGAAEQETV
jgi:cbb3-type cytochrome oxidase subunit 3